MYRRVVFCRVTNPKLDELSDLNKREIFVLVPIVIFIVWIGIYPGSFLRVTEKTTDTILEQVFEPPKAEFK